MNKEQLKGAWQELKGKVKKHWGKLTDSDVEEIDGRFEELSGRIQRVYGRTKEEADKEVDEFLNRS